MDSFRKKTKQHTAAVRSFGPKGTHLYLDPENIWTQDGSVFGTGECVPVLYYFASSVRCWALFFCCCATLPSTSRRGTLCVLSVQYRPFVDDAFFTFHRLVLLVCSCYPLILVLYEVVILRHKLSSYHSNCNRNVRPVPKIASLFWRCVAFILCIGRGEIKQERRDSDKAASHFAIDCCVRV